MLYKEYVLHKGYPLLSIEGGQKFFEKRLNKLKLGDRVVVLDDKSIYDVISLLRDYDPTLSIYRYEERSEDVLQASALFLADFSSDILVEWRTASFPVKLLYSYTDESNSDFRLVSTQTIAEGALVPHSIENGKIVADGYPSIFAKYRSTSLKLIFLTEAIVPSLSMLHAFEDKRC